MAKISFAVLILASLFTCGCVSHQTQAFYKEPFRKGKQNVDLASVTNPKDLEIIQGAIDHCMKLLYALSQVKINSDALNDVTTENGRRILELPPIDSEWNRVRFTKIYNWKVIDGETISFDVDFIGMTTQPTNHLTKHFVFRRVHSAWKFERHTD